MYFVNEYEVDDIMRRAERWRDDKPNNFKGAMVLHRLVVWANNNSDGWAYWPKPMRAATKLAHELARRHFMGRVEDRVYDDLTDAELKALLTPIKTFLTRQGVDHKEIIK